VSWPHFSILCWSVHDLHFATNQPCSYTVHTCWPIHNHLIANSCGCQSLTIHRRSQSTLTAEVQLAKCLTPKVESKSLGKSDDEDTNCSNLVVKSHQLSICALPVAQSSYAKIGPTTVKQPVTIEFTASCNNSPTCFVWAALHHIVKAFLASHA